MADIPTAIDRTAFTKLKELFYTAVGKDLFVGSVFEIFGKLGPKHERKVSGAIIGKKGNALTIVLLFRKARLLSIRRIDRQDFIVRKLYGSGAKERYSKIVNVWEEDDIELAEYLPLFKLLRQRPQIPTEDGIDFKADARIITEMHILTEGEGDALDQMVMDYITARKSYQDGKPIMSDEDFNALEDEIRRLDPENPELQKVGSEVTEDTRERVPLPVPMGSMEKMHPNDGSLNKWLKNIPKGSRFVESNKLDGISVMIEYENGALKRAYKSADGLEGTLITQKIMNIDTVPKLIKTNKKVIRVRGEAIVQKAVFKDKYAGQFANVRNMVAGWFNRKDINPALQAQLRDVHIVCFSIITPETWDKKKQLTQLRTWKFDVVPFKVVSRTAITDDKLTKDLNEARDVSGYDMDGIIVEVDDNNTRTNLGYETNSINPKFARAFKIGGENQIPTTVTEVEWNVAKTGKVKPRVNIQPVKIGGVMVSWATGYNAAFIKDNGIDKGAKIVITRAGDVIPDIVEVTKPKPVLLPDKCPMCDTMLEWTKSYVDLVCPNPHCPGRMKKQAKFFFKSLGVKHVDEGVIEKFKNAGFTSLEDIIKMSKEDILAIEGMGTKSADRIYDGLRAGLTNVYWPNLAHATGLFGAGLGERKLSVIYNEFEGDMDDWDDYTKESIIEAIVELPGFDVTTAEAFADGIIPFLNWLRALDEYIEIAPYAGTNSKKLEGEKIVFTGWRPTPNMKTIIEQNGGQVMSGVSKNTTLLTVKDKSQSSDKMQKAQELHIKIMDKPTFEQWLAKEVGSWS